MTLDDLIDNVMMDTGEFIVGNIDNTLINKDRFWIIVKRALALYQTYKPYTVGMNIYIPGEKFEFPENDIPEWISAVIPGTSGSSPDSGDSSGGSTTPSGGGAGFIITRRGIFSGTLGNFSSIGGTGGLMTPPGEIRISPPTQLVWRYEKPNLYVSAGSGGFDVLAHYNYPYIIERDGLGSITSAEVTGIDNAPYFLDLVEGYFLKSLGRSRRAFTLNDLPVTLDAAELVSEGIDLIDKTKEWLYENSSWYEAVGV